MTDDPTVDAPDAPDDEQPEPEDDVVPEPTGEDLDPEAETAAGTEPNP